MFSYMVVGGRFSNKQSEQKPSGYLKKLYKSMIAINNKGKLINGGGLEDIKNVASQIHMWMTYHGLKVLFWFPDISNDEKKLIKEIKEDNPYLILISSKNNLDGKYQFMELVARALQTKSNLFVEFTNPHDSFKNIHAAVCDPLGNCFGESINIDEIAMVLMYRVSELVKFTRTRSSESGFLSMVPVIDNEFFEIIKKHAETFHECIHGAANPSRLLGNVSFRCESGFPSFRGEGPNDECRIFMSKRNIDKRDIGARGFVPVKLTHNRWVRYSGEHKPSVDAPIQLLLYRYYSQVNFMLHSHTYVEEGITTTKVIPCGAIEEFYEIIKHFPFRGNRVLKINLKGHGSLVMSDTIEIFKDLKYYPRKTPEKQYYI